LKKPENASVLWLKTMKGLSLLLMKNRSFISYPQRVTGYTDEEFNTIAHEGNSHPDYLDYIHQTYNAINPGK
jgi:hypothetical protein